MDVVVWVGSESSGCPSPPGASGFTSVPEEACQAVLAAWEAPGPPGPLPGKGLSPHHKLHSGVSADRGRWAHLAWYGKMSTLYEVFFKIER